MLVAVGQHAAICLWSGTALALSSDMNFLQNLLKITANCVKRSLPVMALLLAFSTVGCRQGESPSAVGQSAQAAFEACVSRLLANYGYESHQCHQVQSYYTQSLAQYVNGPMTSSSINNYFDSYLPQFPPEQISILIDSWNRL